MGSPRPSHLVIRTTVLERSGHAGHRFQEPNLHRCQAADSPRV